MNRRGQIGGWACKPPSVPPVRIEQFVAQLVRIMTL
jgi:hypothetical protein